MITVKKKPSADAGHTRKAYQGIRQMLFHNEIVPGQKIAYRDLAERLGMSQTPVIQALKWLEFQGLVRHERHRGYYTEPISIQEVEGMEGDVITLSEIFKYNRYGVDEKGLVSGQYCSTGIIPKCMAGFKQRGIKTELTLFTNHID